MWTHNPRFYSLWEAATILSHILLPTATPATQPLLLDRRVIEVGAGLGLLGFLAARAGARTVALTDHDPELLRNLRQVCHQLPPTFLIW